MNTSLFYFEIHMSDWWCRIQAYLNYTTLNLVAYSYFIQALFRLFCTVFYRHRFLLNYKFHIILIICQIFISFILPLPSIIRKDIIFRPRKLCLIPMKHIFHLSYFVASTYFILLFLCIIIYTIIYREVTRSTLANRQITRATRRDVKLTRNILIMFMIYSFAGVPGTIYIVISSANSGKPVTSAWYMFVMTTSPISTLIEKISVIFLNKEIKKALRNVLNKLRPFHRSNRTNVKSFSIVNTVNIKPIRTNGLTNKNKPKQNLK